MKDNNIALAQRLAILEYQYKSTHEEQHQDSENPWKVETAAAPERVRRKPFGGTGSSGIALVLFVAFEVYGPALNGEFLFDDSYLPFLMPERR